MTPSTRFLLLACLCLARSFAGTLLQFDFEAPGPWPQARTPGAGTIDVEGGKVGSGGLVLAGGTVLASGPLAVKNTEANLGKLTLAFSLSASAARPVRVRIESFDAGKQRTGALEALIHPAAPDFYQRYALELSDFSPVGTGAFQATSPFVGFSVETRGADGWEVEARHELRLDNVHYASPAFYVRPDGKDTQDGRTEKTAMATPQAALDAARAGDIILLMNGTYNGGMKATASFVRAGEPSAWIVLKNYPGHKPVLGGNGWNIVNFRYGTKEAMDREHSLAYLEARGLHVRGEGDVIAQKYPDTIGKPDSRSNSNGIAVDGRYMAKVPHHIRIANNLVEYCPGQGIGALEADWITFENNTSRFNCWHTIYATSGFSTLGASNFDATDNVYKILIRNNVSYRNETFQAWAAIKKISDGNGIIIDVNQASDSKPDGAYLGRTLVVNNLCFDNGGSGIHTVRANRVDILHNTAYLNSASKALEYSQIYAYGSRDVRILNNILVAPVADTAAGEKPEPVNKLQGKCEDVTFAHNLYVGGNIPPTLGEGDRIGDPRFINATRDASLANFGLRQDSPALASARRVAFSPTTDMSGRPRPQQSPADLGAYQMPAPR